MSRPWVLACLAAVAGSAAWGDAAAAHGPCGCLAPRLAEPGTQVRLVGTDGRQAGGTGPAAYRVVFNPRPSDFGIAPRYLAGAYRADAPTTTVLSRSRHDPTRTGLFRVPEDTPAGLYMVLIWDPGEGGAHNTWDYLHVIGPDDRDDPRRAGVVAQRGPSARPAERDAPTTPGTSASSGSSDWPLVAGAVLGGLVLGFAGGTARRRRRT
jgi:hypothetical protein